MVETILEQLLYNGTYFTTVWPHLKPDYFDHGPYRETYKLIKEHVDEYNSIPTKTALTIALEKKSIDQVTHDSTKELITRLESKPEDLSWLTKETETYCRDKAMYNALSKAIEIQENAQKPEAERNKRLPPIGAIQEIMADALSVTFDSSVGHDWFEDYEKRFLLYQSKANKIPFNIEILNTITKGGAEVGTLNVLMAGVNCFAGDETMEVYINGEPVEYTMKDLHDFVKEAKEEVCILTPNGELTPIKETAVKYGAPAVKVTFSDGHSRVVADTHRFRFNGKEVYAKDATQVETRHGIIDVVCKELLEEPIDVYDLMIESPHWYVDQYGVIHHNTGKSLGLCSLAADYLSQGRNVLYISMEMAEHVCAKRIDANLLDVGLDELDDGNISFAEYKARMERVKAKGMGKLIIKQYPTSGANANHFRALIKELKIKKNFVPEVIMVDYLGICSSTRVRGTENSYVLVKAIAEELRGLAVETNTILWTGAQTTRGAWDASDIDMADVAESAGLPATADFMLAIIETDELAQMGVQMMKQIKSRYGDKNTWNKFNVGIRKLNQRWYSVPNGNGNQQNTKQLEQTTGKMQQQANANLAAGTSKRSRLDNLADSISQMTF